MAFICTVCFDVDYNLDDETGFMRCSGCNTLSQDFANEGQGEEAAGVTFLMSRNVAAAGFIREVAPASRGYDQKAAELEKKTRRKLRAIRLEDAALSLALAYCDYLQTILEWQCQAMIKEMGVSDKLTGIAGEFWLKFVDNSEVLHGNFVETAASERARRVKQYDGHNNVRARPSRKKRKVQEVVLEEIGVVGREDFPEQQVEAEERGVEEEPNMFEEEREEGEEEEGEEGAQRNEGHKFADWLTAKDSNNWTYSHVWVSELKLRIPLGVTLAVLFLACHWLREPVLPTDLVQLQMENRLPYMGAWKLLPDPQNFSGLPEVDRLLLVLKGGAILKPVAICTAHRIEFWGAAVASRLNIDLPPVNYHLLAARFLQELFLPLPTFLPLVERVMDLLVPSPLWITVWIYSAATRITVMSLVVIALKLHCGLTTTFSEEEGGAEGDGGKDLSLCAAASVQPPGWTESRGVRRGTAVRLFPPNFWVVADEGGEGGKWEGASPEDERKMMSMLGVQRKVVTFPADGRCSYPLGELSAYFDYCRQSVLRRLTTASYMEEQSSRLWEAFQQGAGGGGKRGREGKEAELRGKKSIAKEMKRVGCCRVPEMEEELRRWQYVRYTLYAQQSVSSYKTRRYEAAVHSDYFVLVHACARVIGVSWKALFSGVCEHEQKLMEVDDKLGKLARKHGLNLFSAERQI